MSVIGEAAKRNGVAVHEENCAPRRIFVLFRSKWTTMILHALHELHGGSCRTGVLHRSLPGLSKKMLTQTLREMERDGLITRQVFNVVPPRVEYTLTPLGQTFVEPLEMLYEWGRAHASDLEQLVRNSQSHLPHEQIGSEIPTPIKGA